MMGRRGLCLAAIVIKRFFDVYLALLGIVPWKEVGLCPVGFG